MGQNVVALNKKPLPAASRQYSEFVTMRLDGQLFGLPVLRVQDVLRPQGLTFIPLAPKQVAGSFNLRGRVVTMIDLRVVLNLPVAKEKNQGMNVVVEYQDELYSFNVDKVGEVMNLSSDQFEYCPPNLSSNWATASAGVYRLDKEILVVLDIGRILTF